MLKALKSYWAFTNGIYKLVMWVVVPIVLVVGCVLSIREQAGSSIFFLFGLFALDAVSDFFFMNGAYCKGYEFSKLMLSSPRYLQFLNEVTIIDIVRRVLVFQIPFVMELVFAMGDEERMQWCRLNSFLPWLVMLAAQSAVLISRHFVVWFKVHFCIVLVYIVMMFLFVIFAEIFKGNAVGNGILIIAMVAVSVVTVLHAKKKGKEKFYD